MLLLSDPLHTLPLSVNFRNSFLAEHEGSVRLIPEIGTGRGPEPVPSIFHPYSLHPMSIRFILILLF